MQPCQPNGSPQAEAPGGASTIVEVMQRANDLGYPRQLMVTDDGAVRCTFCDTDSAPASLEVAHVVRLEGASDAADELLIALTACPSCSQGATLTLGYGPNATRADEVVLSTLDLTNARPLAAPDRRQP